MNKQLTPRLNRLEPNIVIDGGMEIWPEGTSRSVANNTSAYGAALFQAINISSGITLTNSKQASVPAGTSIPFSNQISKTAAGTLAAGTFSAWSYYVEGYDIQKLMTNEFSVIFWAKSSVASNRSLSVKNSGSTHSFVQQYNISAADTWELKALKIPALSSCPGTLDRTNGVGLNLSFGVVIGSTFQTSSLNQWVAGNFLSGIGEDTTWLTGTTHNFSIAGVMVLPGDWTDLTSAGYSFIRAGRNFQEELAFSQRYYEKSYDLDVIPGTAIGTGVTGFYTPQAATQTETFAVPKRTTPTINHWSANGTASTFSANTGIDPDLQADAALAAAIVGFERGFRVSYSVGGWGRVFHWTADARF